MPVLAQQIFQTSRVFRLRTIIDSDIPKIYMRVLLFTLHTLHREYMEQAQCFVWVCVRRSSVDIFLFRPHITVLYNKLGFDITSRHTVTHRLSDAVAFKTIFELIWIQK